MRIVPIRKIKPFDETHGKKIDVVSESGRRNVDMRLEIAPARPAPFIFRPRKSHFAFSMTALALIIVTSPLLLAFEAHVINVTATLIQLDPPILTPPGDIGWDNPIGGKIGRAHV